MTEPEHQLPAELFMDLDRSGPVPLYFQVSSRLEQAIRDGVVPPGARIENEVSLGNRLGLSRPTIRRAIQELVDKGLLVRRRGIGTQVVNGRVSRNVALTSLHEDLERTGQHPSTRLLTAEVREADAEVAGELGIEPGAPTLHLIRVRSADGVPLAVMDNVLTTDFVDLDTAALDRHGLYQLLRARGTTMRVAKQRIGARAATATECELLGLPSAAAVLTMHRTAYDNAGRVIEYARHCYRPDLYSFEITLIDR